MDVFSFGMLCLWVMFEQHLSGIAPLPQDMRWAGQYFLGKEDKHLSKRVLEGLKLEDKLGLFAQQLVMAEKDLDSDKRDALVHLFSTSLTSEPDRRARSLEHLLCYFTSNP